MAFENKDTAQPKTTLMTQMTFGRGSVDIEMSHE